MSERKSDKIPAQTQRPERPLTPAQRASQANHAQQLAVRDGGSLPSDRRTPQAGEASGAGLSNDHGPAGVNRR